MPMKVCIGRWDLLPKNWDRVNTLYRKTGKEIINEATREEKLIFWGEKGARVDDDFVGVFDLATFEEMFNRYLDDGHEDLNPITHWIKFVNDGSRKLVSLKTSREINEN